MDFHIHEDGGPMNAPELWLTNGELEHWLLIHDYSMARQPLLLSVADFGLSSPKWSAT